MKLIGVRKDILFYIGDRVLDNDGYVGTVTDANLAWVWVLLDGACGDMVYRPCDLILVD